ncbi:MafB-related protein [plant metagenome]|uniref:MafB-related protein n=1 Tax=plant metagenome TaxID=1297885 RepID=A0A484QTX4_9ZZZZ
MQAQCFAREGRVLALESGGERLLLGPRACFDAVAPQLLIQDEAAMRMALGGFLRDSHAHARLASWVGTVEGGGLFDSWRYGADQAGPRVAAMAQSGAIAGMIVPLAQGDAPTPPPATVTGMPAGPVSSWSLEARFRYVLTHMPAYLSGEARQAFAQLLEPAALATTVAVLVVWAGSHAVGVGFIADAALLGIGFALVGWAIFDAIGALAEFFHQTLNAQSTDDLDKAAQSLARCVTTIGVGALIALLTRGAGRLMSRGGNGGGGQQSGASQSTSQTPSQSTQSAAPATPRTQTVPHALDQLPENIHSGQQGKHIQGHNNFTPGRSFLNEGVDPQDLLRGTRAGEFPVVGTGSRGQPVLDFGRDIGVDGTSGLATRYGTIHSGKLGAHIVPANPTVYGN